MCLPNLLMHILLEDLVYELDRGSTCMSIQLLQVLACEPPENITLFRWKTL